MIWREPSFHADLLRMFCEDRRVLTRERDEARRERGQIVKYLLAHPYDCQNDPGIGCEACARENAAMEISRGEHQEEKGEWYKDHPRSE